MTLGQWLLHTPTQVWFRVTGWRIGQRRNARGWYERLHLVRRRG